MAIAPFISCGMSAPVRKAVIRLKIAVRYSLGTAFSISAVSPSVPGDFPYFILLLSSMNCPHVISPSKAVCLASSICASSLKTPSSNGHLGSGRSMWSSPAHSVHNMCCFLSPSAFTS
eukprot:2798786-Rhodomonas_salina.1